MPGVDWYNHNDHIDYPFVPGESSSSASTEWAGLGILDAGFIMGSSSGFDVSLHQIYLYSIARTGTLLEFDFRSDSTEFSAWHFVFTRDLSNLCFGETEYVDAEEIDSSSSSSSSSSFSESSSSSSSSLSSYGSSSSLASGESWSSSSSSWSSTAPTYNLMGRAFLVTGDLSTYAALSEGETHYEFVNVEPSCIQVLASSRVTGITLANDVRRCPVMCGSSSSAAGDGTTFYNTRNMRGAIILREGYNCELVVNAADNTIEVNANLGYGRGQTCVDITITDGGMSSGQLCEPCGDFITDINGVGIAATAFNISGDSGIRLVPDEANHRLVVELNTDLCEV